MTKYVYDFTEGNKDLKDLLGGKGANLAEMTNLGLPVPPGFIITTEACQAYLDSGDEPVELRDEVSEHLAALEKDDGQVARPGRRPAAGVRALRREVLDARDDGDRPQHRAQRRVGAGPGQAGRQRALRLGLLPPADPDVRQDGARHRRRALRGRHRRRQEGQGHRERPRPRRGRPARAGRHLQGHRPRARRARVPDRPARADGPGGPGRLRLVERPARDPLPPPGAHPGRPRHRGQHRARWSSATWAWTPAPASPSPATPAPATRASTATTCRTPRARTSSPASATRSRCRTSRASTSRPTTSSCGIMAKLENHYRDLCDIEFTIERGKLWMLQTRVGKRTAGAAFRIATQLVDQGLIDLDEALTRVTGDQLAQLMFPRFDARRRQGADRQGHERLARARRSARPSSTPTAPRRWPSRGEEVILVRRETNPDDLNGMIAAQGILTSRGGKTSHAAVVARGMGKTCVCGAEELEVDLKAPEVHRARRRRRQRGRRHLDRRHLRRGLPRRGPGRALRGRAVLRGRDRPGGRRRRRAGRGRAPAHGPRRREAPARACAPTPTPPRTPSGPAGSAPQGIGLCRTEHMFLGERRQHVEDLILAETDDERQAALDALEPLQRDGLRRHLQGDGRPAGHGPAARPAAARVPARPHRPVGQGRPGRGAGRGHLARPARCSTRSAGCTSRTRCSACAAYGSAWSSPGCSACRSGRSPRPRPELQGGGQVDPKAEIMVPLVGAVQELEAIRDEALADPRRGPGAHRPGPRGADRHDDRGAARRADRRARSPRRPSSSPSAPTT